MKQNRWKHKAERAAWIFYQLRLRGTTAAAVGRRMKPPGSRRMMAYVISGQKISRVCQEAVARALGMTWEEIWGADAIQEREQWRAG
jgi:lambda repressor-like predicted transcriptional regulator